MARFRSTAIAAIVILCSTVLAQETGKNALVEALRAGGYVIVMRHASSPRAKPDAASAAPGNVDLERQLDDNGRETAKAMGEAIRRLRIPVGEVLSSPTFRAMQTARLLSLAAPTAVPELGDGGQGMREDREGTRSAWLRTKAGDSVPAHTNRLLITHVPNLRGAFGEAADGMGDGESLIIKPDGGRAVVIGRVKIAQWSSFATD